MRGYRDLCEKSPSPSTSKLGLQGGVFEADRHELPALVRGEIGKDELH